MATAAGMITLILTGLLRLFRTRRALVLKNLNAPPTGRSPALLAAPRLRRSDRLF
jgi:hypothetical protein